MNWYEWIIVGLVWMLFPLALWLKANQDKKFRKWQEEDQQNINKYIKNIK